LIEKVERERSELVLEHRRKEDALRNQRLFVLNAFGADRRRKSDLVFRINTPRVRIKKSLPDESSGRLLIYSEAG